MNIRPEVAEADEHFGAGVGEGDAIAGFLGGHKDFILGHFAEPDEDRLKLRAGVRI